MKVIDRLELMEEVDELRCRGSRPRVHGNGFIQLDLDKDRRLHVWGDPHIPRQRTHTPIHDHTFSFTSVVITGQLVHRHYWIDTMTDGAYWMYRALVRDKEDTVLERVGDYRYHATIVQERLLSTGSTYSFEAEQFHETVAPWPCATMVTKNGRTLAQGGPSPRVMVPVGSEPDNQFNRYAGDATVLWRIIRNTLHHVPA